MPAQIKITKRTVDRIESDGSDRFYWDRELPGFGLRVRASGRKFFVTQFRANGKARRMTLGPVTAVTPDDARRRAMALLAEAKAGGDPAAQRDTDRKTATVKALGERFLDEYVPAHCKRSTAYEYRRSVVSGAGGAPSSIGSDLGFTPASWAGGEFHIVGHS